MSEATYVCEGCGCLVAERLRETHETYESVVSSHGWAIAVLQTAHISAEVHNHYDVRERINRKKFKNWSDRAFKEVTGLDPRPKEGRDE